MLRMHRPVTLRRHLKGDDEIWQQKKQKNQRRPQLSGQPISRLKERMQFLNAGTVPAVVRAFSWVNTKIVLPVESVDTLSSRSNPDEDRTGTGD